VYLPKIVQFWVCSHTVILPNPDANGDGISETAYQCALFQPEQLVMQPSDTSVDRTVGTLYTVLFNSACVFFKFADISKL